MKRSIFFTALLLAICLLSVPKGAQALSVCNQTGSDIRFANHYTAVAFFFGGKKSFTGWHPLSNGQCKHIGADNGQQDIYLIVQTSGWFRWKTLTASNYSVRGGTFSFPSGHWRLANGSGSMCVPDSGTFKTNFARQKTNGPKCAEGYFRAPFLLRIDTFSNRVFKNYTLYLGKNQTSVR